LPLQCKLNRLLYILDIYVLAMASEQKNILYIESIADFRLLLIIFLFIKRCINKNIINNSRQDACRK